MGYGLDILRVSHQPETYVGTDEDTGGYVSQQKRLTHHVAQKGHDRGGYDSYSDSRNKAATAITGGQDGLGKKDEKN